MDSKKETGVKLLLEEATEIIKSGRSLTEMTEGDARLLAKLISEKVYDLITPLRQNMVIAKKILSDTDNKDASYQNLHKFVMECDIASSLVEVMESRLTDEKQKVRKAVAERLLRDYLCFITQSAEACGKLRAIAQSNGSEQETHKKLVEYVESMSGWIVKDVLRGVGI